MPADNYVARGLDCIMIIIKAAAIFFLLVCIIPSGGAFAEQSAITEQTCDAFRRCPEGLECYSFPGKGPRCAAPNPCTYVECGTDQRCVMAMSYPAQIFCTDINQDSSDDGQQPVESAPGQPSTAPGYNPDAERRF